MPVRVQIDTVLQPSCTGGMPGSGIPYRVAVSLVLYPSFHAVDNGGGKRFEVEVEVDGFEMDGVFPYCMSRV